MKLYECELNFVTYVAAESEDEAKEILRKKIYDVKSDISYRDFDIYEADAVFADWMDSRPWGDTDKKCRDFMDEIIAKRNESEYKKKHYVSLPGM